MLAGAIAKLGGNLIRWRGPSRERFGGASLSRLEDTDAVARTFQVAFLALTTLMVLCFTSTVDRLTDFLFKAYCGAATLLLIIGFREGAARGKQLIQNTFLLAAAFGLLLSLIVGVIVHVLVDTAVHAYVQVH